jgi:DNA-binding NarL/FixJ family response regulator
MSGSRIRVIIADDHDLVRNGLAVLLEAFPDLGLVGSASNGQEVIMLCDRIEADVVLMDLDMPRIGGIPATRTLRRCHPRIQIVALIGFDEGEMVEEVMAAGAAGYVYKNAPIDAVAKAIRDAAAHGAGPDLDLVAGGRGPLQQQG